MATCNKCKAKLGMFDKAYDCMSEDCTKKFCEKCADTELIDCKYCDDSFCKECLKDHEPDCKEENETVEEEEETCDDCGELLEDCTCGEDVPDGMYFSKDKTICMLDIENNMLNNFIDQLGTLRANYVLDKELSSDKELVWIKKV